MIAGIDEVGLGAWAGPLVVTAVVNTEDWALAGLTDSKALSSAKRERFARVVQESCRTYTTYAQSDVIDRHGVGAVHRALIERLIAVLCSEHPGVDVVVDGALIFRGARSIPRADRLLQVVSGASVVAKVTRDHWMARYSERFAPYGFEKNKGYGNTRHAAALAAHGPCPLHRTSYSPIRALIAAMDNGTVAAWQTRYRGPNGSTV